MWRCTRSSSGPASRRATSAGGRRRGGRLACVQILHTWLTCVKTPAIRRHNLAQLAEGTQVRVLPCAAVALSFVAIAVRANPAEYSQAMLKLATERGCMACHSVLPPPKRADGLPPIAPAWRDIAIRYRDDPGASERLTQEVMTGSDRQARHWSGKVSDVGMPGNADVVTEQEARILVNWLLVLVP